MGCKLRDTSIQNRHPVLINCLFEEDQTQASVRFAEAQNRASRQFLNVECFLLRRKFVDFIMHNGKEGSVSFIYRCCQTINTPQSMQFSV